MLKQKLQEDQIIALKSGDHDKLNIIRFIISQIKNKEIEKRSELSDDEVILVLKKIAKELNESISAFEKGNRQDLVEENKKQLTIISQYLPQEISDEELKKEIKRIIQENQDLYQKNPKAIIGICIKQLKSKADSSRIIKILSAYENS
jgi:hypothetical protein